MISRRLFLTGLTGTAFIAFQTGGSFAASAALSEAKMRGSLNAADAGLLPGAFDAQSRVFQDMIDRASDADEAIYLPAGDYLLSNITLPERVRIAGVKGGTRLIFSGGDFFFATNSSAVIELDGLTFDGRSLPISQDMQAIFSVRNCREVQLNNCEFTGSPRHALYLENCRGHVENCTITNALEAALYCVGAKEMRIGGNTISDCGNGGIWVHRFEIGDDGTQVVNNRISRISSTNGGTGQWGNGINAFQANNVMIANNTVSDCAFSAIRANSASNIQILGNQCLNSGETGIYAEFRFEGAVINNNVVDGAANGISVVNFNEGGRLASVQGNLVRNLKTDGPYPAEVAGFGYGIAIEADTTALGNTIENAPKAGFLVGWGEFMRNIVITGNVVRKANIGVQLTVVEGTGKALITDNIFDDIKGAAIGGFRWADQVTGDLAKGGEMPKNVTIERNSST
ncbi:MAG: TIGR03808 family TAT-translocated repetitive protein [Notoacmeibacter sp.]